MTPALTRAQKSRIKYLGDVRRLALHPGDVVVLYLPGHASPESVERVKAAASVLIPDHRIMVLADGIKIGVLGSGEERAR